MHELRGNCDRVNPVVWAQRKWERIHQPNSDMILSMRGHMSMEWANKRECGVRWSRVVWLSCPIGWIGHENYRVDTSKLSGRSHLHKVD